MRDQLHKQLKRHLLQEAGALDGRYRQRTTRDKSKYSRKKKHKDAEKWRWDRAF